MAELNLKQNKMIKNEIENNVTNGEDMKSKRYLNVFKIGAVLGIAFSIAGCAVQPIAITDEDRSTRIANDKLNLFADQEPLQGALTLGEAMVRAILYNLDNRLKFMELAVAQRNLDFSNKAMLPDLVARAGYNERSNDPGARSIDVVTGEESLPASTSRERTTQTTDLEFLWNVLDLGISYHNAHQRSDEVLIAKERQRKTVQNIVQDVVDAYWKAWTAQQLAEEMTGLITDTEGALESSRELASSQSQSKREALGYQTSLLRIRNSLYELQERMGLSKIRLAALINIDPESEYVVAQPSQEYEPLDVARDYGSLSDNALMMRPELREEDYRRRISVREVKKSILRLFPSIQIGAGYHTDENEFLTNDDFSDFSVNISWNILGLLAGNSEKKFREAQVDLADARRLALSMAVMTQVKLALKRYEFSVNKYRSSSELADISQQYTDVVLSSTRDSDLDKIRASTESLLSQVRNHYDFAETQTAYARVLNSIGIDVMPAEFTGENVKAMGNEIEENWGVIRSEYL